MFAKPSIFGTNLLDLVFGIGTSIFVIAICCSVLPAQQQVQIDATIDSACINTAPDNNFGAHVFTPVGVGSDGSIRRGLYFFDIAGSVPAGATITNVEFLFDVIAQGEGDVQQGADFALHIFFDDWDEGTGSSNEGEATFDGCSWNDAQFGVPWDIPGGVFSFLSSGSVFVDNPNGTPTTYSIGSPVSNLINSVQNMLDNPKINRGFVLRALDETGLGSTAQIVSREGADGKTSATRLIVEYTTDVIRSATGYSLDRGVLVSGTTFNLLADDDERLILNPGFTLKAEEAPVALQFSGILPDNSLTSLEFFYESQAGTPSLTATYEAYNWNTFEYDLLGEIAETFNVDSVVSGTLSPADHINPGNTPFVRSRIGWRQTGFTLVYPWEVRVDHVFWLGQ